MSAYTYVRGFTALHHGVDLSASTGTPIHAVAGGRVAYARDERADTSAPWYSRGGGMVVHVDSGDGRIEQYAHCSAIAVHLGQWIAAGTVVGAVGMTGDATGPHLHFAVFVPHLNAFVDPLKLMTLAQLIAAVSGGDAASSAASSGAGSSVTVSASLLEQWLASIHRSSSDPIRDSDVIPFVQFLQRAGVVPGGDPSNPLVAAVVTVLHGLVGRPWSDVGPAFIAAGNAPQDPFGIGAALNGAVGVLTGALTSGLWLGALLVLLILGLYLTLTPGTTIVAAA